MATVQFIQYTPQQLQEEITAGVKKQLSEFLEKFKPTTPAEYLTRVQVATLFSVDLSTVHNWTRSGRLRAVGIGSRVYYLRSEIEKNLIPLNQ